MSKISVICPVYNTEKYLTRCFDSVINQTFSDFEFIIINDGSSDNSNLICYEYSKKDSRIKYISFPENRGIGIIRNIGLQTAKYNYITWIDSDDWVEIDWLETMYNNLVNSDADISIINTRNVYEKISNIPLLSENNLIFFNTNEALLNLINNNYISNALMDKLVKKELYEKVFFPNRTSQDGSIMHILIFRANKIVYSNSQKYNYFYRLNSIQHKYSIKLEYDRFCMLKDRYDFFLNTNLQHLLNMQINICFKQGIRILLMSLFRRNSLSETLIIENIISMFNIFFPELNTETKELFYLYNCNFLKKLYIFLKYESIIRIKYFIKNNLSFLTIIYRKIKFFTIT